MLDLKLIYILLTAFTVIFSILFTYRQEQLTTFIKETAANPSRIFGFGLLNAATAVFFLYTSLYFFPNLTWPEIIVTVMGVAAAVKAVYLLFWPQKMLDKMMPVIETKLVLFKNGSIIISLLFIYILTTL